jgi:hypothetical protein
MTKTKRCTKRLAKKLLIRIRKTLTLSGKLVLEQAGEINSGYHTKK